MAANLRGSPLPIVLIVLLVALSACGSQRPVLYPNAHLNKVGQGVAQQDIDACMELAETHGVDSTSGTGESAGNVAKGAAVGGAAGAAAGAISGRAGRGAAIGAAGAGAGTAMRELFRKRQPAPIYKNFVTRCLREKGYETIGWK